MLADVSIATGWCTIALMLLGKFVFQCEFELLLQRRAHMLSACKQPESLRLLYSISHRIQSTHQLKECHQSAAPPLPMQTWAGSRLPLPPQPS